MNNQITIVDLASSPATNSIDYETIKYWLKSLYNFRFCTGIDQANTLLTAGTLDPIDAYSVIGSFPMLFETVLNEKAENTDPFWATVVVTGGLDAYRKAKSNQDTKTAAEKWNKISAELDRMSDVSKQGLSAAFTVRLYSSIACGLAMVREKAVIVLVRWPGMAAYDYTASRFGKCGSQHYTADDFDKVIFSGSDRPEMIGKAMGALEARIRELGA
ncbi:MAG: hypothetical protein Q9195_005568 [Heterodermia aff. obscurata]